jgi:hypothetical protein
LEEEKEIERFEFGDPVNVLSIKRDRELTQKAFRYAKAIWKLNNGDRNLAVELVVPEKYRSKTIELLTNWRRKQ